MEEIKIFNSEEFGDIRTVTIDNEPWFVGKDVATALGYKTQKTLLLLTLKNVTKLWGRKTLPHLLKTVWEENNFRHGLTSLVYTL